MITLLAILLTASAQQPVIAPGRPDFDRQEAIRSWTEVLSKIAAAEDSVLAVDVSLDAPPRGAWTNPYCALGMEVLAGSLIRDWIEVEGVQVFMQPHETRGYSVFDSVAGWLESLGIGVEALIRSEYSLGDVRGEFRRELVRYLSQRIADRQVLLDGLHSAGMSLSLARHVAYQDPRTGEGSW